MKRHLLIFVLSIGFSVAYAQQQPSISQYMLNNYFANPAYGGSDAQLDLTLLHRAQWAGYKDYQGNGASQKTDFFQARYSPDSTGHIVGLQFVHDAFGALKTTEFQLSYAYRISLTKKSSLALGARAGITSMSIDFADRQILHPDDPLIPETKQSQTRPDVTLGAWLEHEAYYVGASVKGVVQSDFESLGVSREQLVTVTAGYHLPVGTDWTLTPSAQVMTNTDRTVVDGSLLFQQANRVWAGVSYRHEEAAILLAGFGLFDSKLRIGYSFDYVTSNRSIKTGSSHEIMLRYSIGKWHKRKPKVRQEDVVMPSVGR